MSTPVVIPDSDDESMSPCSVAGEAAFPQHAFHEKLRFFDATNAAMSLKRDREREGRCSECGAQTHLFRTDPFTGLRVKFPLTIEREVHRGRCLLCLPLGSCDNACQFSPSFQMQQSSIVAAASTTTSSQNAAFGRAETTFCGYANPALQEVICQMRKNSADIVDVLYIMKLYRQVESVQVIGCEALWVHSWDDETAAAIGRVGGIARILDAMSLFSDNTYLQRCGCEALQNLALHDCNRSLIVDFGGVALIVQAMMRHLDARGIQQCGCIAIASLASSREYHDDIIRAGGFHALIHAARNHPMDENIRYGVCQAYHAVGHDPCEYVDPS